MSAGANLRGEKGPAELEDRNVPHLMVDLETMGTGRDAAILSIGAVIFNPHHATTAAELRTRTYYATVGLQDNVKCGRVIDPGTVIWWLQQSDGARSTLFENNVSLLNALAGLRKFADLYPRPKFIWAKGPTFDISILRHAFGQVKEQFPFHYMNERCVRTAEDMGFPNGDLDKPELRVGDHHNALDDAITQALMVQAAYANLGLRIETTAVNGFVS